MTKKINLILIESITGSIQKNNKIIQENNHKIYYFNTQIERESRILETSNDRIKIYSNDILERIKSNKEVSNKIKLLKSQIKELQGDFNYTDEN